MHVLEIVVLRVGDRVAHDVVAADQHAALLLVEKDVTGRVAGGVEDAQLEVLEGDAIPLAHHPIHRRRGTEGRDLAQQLPYSIYCIVDRLRVAWTIGKKNTIWL